MEHLIRNKMSERKLLQKMSIRIVLSLLLLIAIIVAGFFATNLYLFRKLQDPGLIIKLNTDLHSTITSCILQKVASPATKGEVFCTYKVLGVERLNTNNSKADPIIRAYLYTYCAEFYKDGRYIREGSAGQIPIVLDIQKDQVIACNQPPLAGHYSSAVKKLFPTALQKQLFDPVTMDKFSQEMNTIIHDEVHENFGDLASIK